MTDQINSVKQIKYPTGYYDFTTSVLAGNFTHLDLKSLHKVWVNNPNVHSSVNTLNKIEFLEGYFRGDRITIIEPQPKLEDIEFEVGSDYHVATKFLLTKKGAESRGKEFNLTLKEIKRLLNRKTCYYTGERMNTKTDGLRDEDRRLTFDRIDGRIGYVIGNVVACTHWANDAKNKLFEHPDSVGFGKIKKIKRILDKL
jgi:hypothetical protein